jgi:cell division protein FtsZ
MKNGGVAILGSAACEGENRAQDAIIEAISSPLLNDSDIKGAKWILININSAEGDYECTMDEIDLINEYLRAEAGEHTDVIVGMGIDNTLDKKIGITIIATGFDFKDPFAKQVIVKEQPKEEKIVLTLGQSEIDEKKITEAASTQQAIPFIDKNPFEPQLIEQIPTSSTAFDMLGMTYSSNDFDANRETVLATQEPEIFSLEFTSKEPETLAYFGTIETVQTPVQEAPLTVVSSVENSIIEMTLVEHTSNNNTPILNKPSNIYSSYNVEPQHKAVENENENIETNTFELSIKETPIAETFQTKTDITNNETESSILEVNNRDNIVTTPIVSNVALEDLSEEEEQRRRALERIQKLRSLSFNMNSSDATTEFDNVPAYVRRNMELFGNTLTTVENFYGRATVEKNDNNETYISTKNSFLEGHRPD